jgi:hypothetical protein
LPTARDLPAPFSLICDCAFADNIAPIEAGDNDWLRLTGDDQARLKSSMERCDA